VIPLELYDCPALSQPALREHVDLELKTLDLAGADAHLRVRCQGSAVTITLSRASGAPYPIEVRVELRDTARAARERLIALAATELVAQAERAQGQQEPAKVTAPAASSSPGPPRDTGSEPRHASVSGRLQHELFLAGSVAQHGRPSTTLWGGSLGAALGLTPRWSLLLDTRFERGQGVTELADVRWSVLSGFVGPLLSMRWGPVRPALGLGLRAGWLALDATATLPDQGRSMTAPWAGLALPLRLGADLGEFAAPFLGGELGWVFAPVRGNVQHGASVSTLMEQRGLWLTAQVGIGLRL
jgi:hypothetical protein